MLGQLDHLAGQQLKGPAGSAAGGAEQAVATSRASSLPHSLRSAPGRGSSLKRCLQVACHEAALGPVNRRAADADRSNDLLVAGSAIGRQQDLRPLQLARRMLAAVQQRPELGMFGLAQLDPVPYIHRSLLEGETTRIER